MTISIDVVTDSTVLDVLTRADRPVPTLEIVDLLAAAHGVDVDQVSVTRLRRILDRLEDQLLLEASGGPKRVDRRGWSQGDRRDVLWATAAVADRITEEVEALDAENEQRGQRRRALLRALHKFATPPIRETLGLTGITALLKEDPDYRGEGATGWSLEVLEAVCRLSGIEA